MSPYQHREKEEIWQSWEFQIRERLESLDRISRKMFSEMGIFGVSAAVSQSFVQEKMTSLIAEVVQSGNADAVQEQNKLRRGKRGKVAVNTH